MGLSQERISYFADELYRSRNEVTSIDPLSLQEPEITIPEAYAVQMQNVKKDLALGKRITGKKIGLTSLAMQRVFNVDQPDYGHLFDDMEVVDGKICADSMILPRVEAEITFHLKSALTSAPITVDKVLAATDYVVASLEIVDSRIKDWKIKIVDTIADNASSGKYVLSSRRVDPRTIDLKGIKMEFFKNGEKINEGMGKDALGDPAYCVAWLAECLKTYNVTLNAGEVILSGALSAALPAVKGDHFEARFSELGSVSVEFV
jgi:2-keto-4-pentenoate hydratase